MACSDKEIGIDEYEDTLDREIHYDASGNIRISYEIEYDENHKWISETKYDADGNTKQLGSFGIDDSYRTREEINPNWPEIDGSWRIEDGKLIRTITSGNQEKRYIVKSLDRDGYYLLCFESATGEVNAVMMIVYMMRTICRCMNLQKLSTK